MQENTRSASRRQREVDFDGESLNVSANDGQSLIDIIGDSEKEESKESLRDHVNESPAKDETNQMVAELLNQVKMLQL